MSENKTELRSSIAAFRKQLMDDPIFRQAFAADPEGTLRASGIAVPMGTNLAAIDAGALEARVGRLKQALGEDVEALYGNVDFLSDPARRPPSELSGLQLDAVAGGRKKADVGDVYTISAFGTLDW